MSTGSTPIDNLIARYLAGEASAEERKELARWMESVPENKKYVEGIQFVHEKAAASHPYVRVDVDRAWHKLNTRMGETGKPARMVSFPRRSWFQVAASLTILAVVSVLLYYVLLPSVTGNKAFTLQSDDTILTRSLANIETTLNRHSKVTFTTAKHGREKNVALTGEAFFRVNHSPDTVVVVHAGETFIRDIGTSFNVQAYADSSTVVVYVTSGEVAFYTENNTGIRVRKGETGIYQKQRKEFRKKEVPDPNSIAYHSKEFVFRNTPLGEVISALNRVYDQKFALDPRIAGPCTITVTFSNESPREIAGILAETLGLEVAGNDTVFVLKGESCSGQP